MAELAGPCPNVIGVFCPELFRDVPRLSALSSSERPSMVGVERLEAEVSGGFSEAKGPNISKGRAC